MKITKDHLERLAALIKHSDTPQNRERYKRGEIVNFDMVRNLDMRYRWDCMWGDVPTIEIPTMQKAIYVQLRRELVDEMYAYLNDTHIDSALKSLVPPLAK